MANNRFINLWDDPFLSGDKKLVDELTEKDKELLCRLKRGERGHGLNLERIHGARKGIMTIRTNKKRRLFLLINKQGEITVFHIMKNHKYNRVNALPQHVAEFIFEASLEAIKQALNYQEVDTIDGIIPDPNLKPEHITFKDAVCYNQNFIVYDEQQNTTLSSPLPFLLHGDFGSGKSAIARTMLLDMILKYKDILPNHHFVYYSHLPELVRHMFEMFLLDNPNLGAVIDINRVKFLDTAGLVREYGPALLTNKKSVGIEAFKLAISKAYQAKVKKGEAAFLNKIDIDQDIDVLYDEFQIIATKQEAYLQAGEHASNYASEDVRAWLKTVCDDYLKALDGNNEYDPNLILWQPTEKPVAFFVGDEMQGAPRSPMTMALQITQGGNVAFCCDSNQSEKRLSPIPAIKELFMQQGLSLTVCNMPGSYRCPPYLMPLINYVIRLKQYINGGLNDNLQASEVVSKSQAFVNKGSIQWVDLKTCEALKAKLNEKSTVFVIITQAEYIKEAKEKFGEDVPVYTPEQARGMEFPVVVYYRLMDKPRFKKSKHAKQKTLAMEINRLIVSMPQDVAPAKHQPKPGKANPQYEPDLNAWVIAFSRLVGEAHCFVVEQENEDCAHLQNGIKAAIKQGEAMIAGIDHTLSEGSNEEWEALAQSSILAGNRAQALVAYQRLGKTEAMLNEVIARQDKYKQARIDSIMNESKINCEPVESQQPNVAPSPPAKPTLDRSYRNKKKRKKQEALQLSYFDQVFRDHLDSYFVELSSSENRGETLHRLNGAMSQHVWLENTNSGQLFMLEVLSDKANCRAMYELILRDKSERMQLFNALLVYCFSKINWFLPYQSSDLLFTRLHWMAEDTTRMMVFKNVMILMEDKPLIGADKNNEVTTARLLTPYQSVTLNTMLPLVALLATKYIDLLIKLLLNNPSLLQPISQGLLASFVIKGSVTNAINYIHGQDSNATNMLLLDRLLVDSGQAVYKYITSAAVEALFLQPTAKEAIKWCADLTNRLKARRAIAEKDEGLLTTMFDEPGIVDTLKTVIVNRKSFFENMIFHQAMRECFFKLMAGLVENDELVLKRSLIMNQFFNALNLNALVQFHGQNVPLISCIIQGPHSQLLLTDLEDDNPVKFYLERVNTESLTRPYYTALMKENVPLLYLTAKRAPNIFRDMLYYLKFVSLDPSFWLQAWRSEKGDNAGILLLLIGHAFDEGGTHSANAHLALYEILIMNERCLVKHYIETEAFYQSSILFGQEPNYQNYFSLFDACLYLGKYSESTMAAFCEQIGELVINGVNVPYFFKIIWIEGRGLPVLYYLTYHEPLLNLLKNKIEGLTEVERLSILPELTSALTESHFSDSTLSECSWSALAQLSTSVAGMTFLCDLLQLFPELSDLLRVTDFKKPGADLSESERDQVLVNMMQNIELYRHFSQLVSPNRKLGTYVSAATFGELVRRGQAESKESNLQALSLFSASNLMRSCPVEPVRLCSSSIECINPQSNTPPPPH